MTATRLRITTIEGPEVIIQKTTPTSLDYKHFDRVADGASSGLYELDSPDRYKRLSQTPHHWGFDAENQDKDLGRISTWGVS